MQLKQRNNKPLISQDILVIADCINGAEKAASFAVRNLDLDDSAMILLQTYQKRGFGQGMLRNITSLLEKTAQRELSELKNKIVRNTDISPQSIWKVVMEGDLLSVLRQKFGNNTDTTVILGLDEGMAKPSTYCKKLIVSVLKSGLRPLFIIDESISLINKDSVTYFSGDKNLIDGSYFQFLSSIFSGFGLEESNIVNSADPNLKPEKNMGKLLNSEGLKYKDDYPLAEKLFRSMIEGRNDVVIQTVKTL